MVTFGSNKAIRIEKAVDSDGDLEISMTGGDHEGYAESWLDRNEAFKIIKHLQDVFDISLDEI